MQAVALAGAALNTMLDEPESCEIRLASSPMFFEVLSAGSLPGHNDRGRISSYSGRNKACSAFGYGLRQELNTTVACLTPMRRFPTGATRSLITRRPTANPSCMPGSETAGEWFDAQSRSCSRDRVRRSVGRISDPRHGWMFRNDLQDSLSASPISIQELLRDLSGYGNGSGPAARSTNSVP